MDYVTSSLTDMTRSAFLICEDARSRRNMWEPGPMLMRNRLASRFRASGRAARAMLAVVAALTPLGAQPVVPRQTGVIRGIVTDSVHGGALAGAYIQLVPGG